jgi:hypothetical protein
LKGRDEKTSGKRLLVGGPPEKFSPSTNEFHINNGDSEITSSTTSVSRGNNQVVMMQGKNGKPWPTAIDPKFLAQTQIGTMIQSSQNMTIVDQLMNDKSKFQEIDMGKFDEDDKQYIYVDL